MKCPYCHCLQGVVLDSRETPDNEAVRRRRRCEGCGRRFTTYERVEEVEIKVIKKDGRQESFDRDKLRRGIIKATWKRPVSREKIEELLNEVEKEIRVSGKHEIPSLEVGGLALEKLKRLDSLSYLLFASIYRDFNSLEDFQKEIESLLDKN
ncbi:transcriptional repressor NrdR [bacterium]|nr:transcriptional repressor NrdR [bacterium]MBQ6436353.1 transcriptional repressor NrdR [bacterium]